MSDTSITPPALAPTINNIIKASVVGTLYIAADIALKYPAVNIKQFILMVTIPTAIMMIVPRISK